MKGVFKSIQWRLQIWHGAILLLVLAAFGITAYQLVRVNRFRLIDQELERHAREMAETVLPTPDNPNFLKMWQSLMAGTLSNSPGQGLPSSENSEAANFSFPLALLSPRTVLEKVPLKEENGFYFVFYGEDRNAFRKTKNAPDYLPALPPDLPSGLTVRTRGNFREHLMSTRAGFSILIGRSIANDLTDLRRQAWIMLLIGSAIAILGLAGGRWLAKRAVKPIGDISAAVQKITSGNLSLRINLSETDNELGQLAADLNATFDRVQSSFVQLQSALERQKQFTADASHELRTPLAVILAEVNSALARDRTPEYYREAMECCRRATRRMRHLTESLLTLARLDSDAGEIERGPCALDQVVLETLEVLRALADECHVTLHPQLSPATVVGNTHQLGQVVSNLVSNAIYYNRPGGQVHVRLKPVGSRIELQVEDYGQGISSEDLPHIFNRFYRADASRSQASGHTGLGLAITKAIVELHCGTIEVTSTLNEGSTFKVFLPRQASPSV